MPTYPIQLKRNGTAAATPSSLLHGEVALNYADGKLFWKDASNVIQSFTFQSYALASHTHAASDITSGTLDAARIANDSITYAKIQNVSATDRLLGRSSVGAGDVEEILCGSFGRSLIGSADAAAARSTLSVQPTASPAFTGAATVTNDGDVVPLTVTNTGTANSFVVNDASGDASPFVIDASGGVGVGGSPSAIAKVHVLGNLPASASTQGFRMTGEIPSAATATATSYISFPSTQASSFTLASLFHYRAFQGTFGAGSAVTSQFGYHADASLIGATNNYGFYSDIASGTGRWNFYANGTAANYFAGNVGIGTSATQRLHIHEPSANDCYARWTNTDSGTSTGLLIGINGNEHAVIRNEIANKSLFLGAGNADKLELTSSGQLLVTAGSGTGPSSYVPGLAVSGDPDTGLQQVGGANTISLVTAGSERVRVDAGGNVGIGAAPGTTLDIQRASADAAVFVQGQTSSTGATLQLYSGAGLGYVGTRNNYPLLITSNNAERMRVKTTGSVRFFPLSADPSTGNEAGDVYYNSSTNKLRVYNGTSWVDLH